MYHKKKKSELERKLYRGFMLISTLVILLSLGGTLYFDILRQRKEVDTMISGIAAYISEGTDVVKMLESGYPSPYVKQSLDALYATIPNVSIAEVCNKDGVRFYHTDRQSTGESYVDGEEIPILQGSKPYITIGYNTKGAQRRAFHAVRNAKGEIIGFVMVSVFIGVISARVQSIMLVHLMILGVMLIISFFLSHAILRFMRKTLMGFQPEELLRRYLRQDVVLSAVAEGLVASDTAGTVLFVNSAARSLIGEDQVLEGRPIIELLPDTRQEVVLRTGQPEERRSWIVGGHSVLANEVPILKDSKSPAEGVLTVLYDRTEMLHMSDELFGARSMIDALRSYNHEFSNRLHVILGYLETRQYEKAIGFIVNSNLISGQVICQTADQIRVSELCALVVGKIMHAAEQGIQLKLMGDSCCIEQDLLIPVDDMTTIVGNLLENAIEDLNIHKSELQEIKFGLFCRPDCNILVCEDTGRGISHEVMEHMFEKGFSTKGQYRGTGLYLVRRIVRQYGGRIDIETEGGEGTVFTITFTREEQKDVSGNHY
ncbi:sensor histidine kinase [Faecalispora anaeroviscerum]|uniref:sensor histidine kinase n=1 Tax=Faecalispora anaeroviscerum TaxID=2991836 RepID=UPI0024B95F2A|nr:ATP-binding protein [Faecalispora anaeroviscerum]